MEEIANAGAVSTCCAKRHGARVQRRLPEHDKGVYHCAGCGLELFSSDAKFNSGTGWPSFFKPLAAERVHEETDVSYGMRRTEVLCARCEGIWAMSSRTARNQPACATA
jgi:peptide methionine sulfoxide reductase MsrB